MLNDEFRFDLDPCATAENAKCEKHIDKADDGLRDPLTRTQSQDLLELFDDRYGRSSTLVATQVPVAEWHARFPDPTIGDAILDRLVHNAYRLNLKGESRRKINSPLTMPTT